MKIDLLWKEEPLNPKIIWGSRCFKAKKKK